MTEPTAMLAAEADIQTEHAARYLARLCGHAAKMGTVGRRLGHRRPSHAPGGTPPQVQRVESSAAEGTVTLNWGRWTIRARPGLLTIRAEAADEANLRRIQDMLTTRLRNLGRREQLTVAWRAATAEARTIARPEGHEAERGGSSAPVPPDCRPPDRGDGGSGK